MPQSERCVVLMFDFEDWQLLQIEAAKRGTEVRTVVFHHVKELLDVLDIETSLEAPEEAPFKLDGDKADKMGSEALSRAARRRGLHFEVVGGKMHDGKVFNG